MPVGLLLQVAASAALAAERPLDAPERMPARVAVLCPATAGRPRAELERLAAAAGSGEAALSLDAACLHAARYLLDLSSPSTDRTASARRRAAQQRTVDILQGLLRRRPGDARAAELLATLMPALGEGQFGFFGAPETAVPMEGVAPLLLRAVRQGVTVPVVLRVCSGLHLALGDAAAARACGDRALRVGSDSGWHMLRAGWMAHCLRDTVAMVEAFEAALALADDEGLRAELRSIAHPPISAEEDALLRAKGLRWNSAHPDGWERVVAAPRDQRASRLREHLARNPVGDTTVAATLWRGMSRHRPVGTLLARAPSLTAEQGGAPRDPCRPPFVRGLPAIALEARLVRMWDPTDRAPLALVSYAWRRGDVRADGGQVALTLNTWSAARRGGAASLWPASEPRAILTVAGDDALSAWTLVVQQDGARLGRTGEDGGQGIVPGPLRLSDLVVEDSLEGTDAVLGTEAIRFAPTTAVSRGRQVPLVFQRLAERAFPGARTTIAIHRARPGGREPVAALTVSFDTPVPEGLSFTRHAFDMRRLDRGEHDLEITVHDAATNTRIVRSTRIMLR